MIRHPFGTFGRNCAVCGRRKPQQWWSGMPTCSRTCGKTWKQERLAANRPHLLAVKGVEAMPPLKAWRLGYMAGYHRGRRYLSARVAS
jgi:hypothetical protein